MFLSLRGKSVIVCLLLVALGVFVQTWRSQAAQTHSTQTAAGAASLQGAAAWQQIKRSGGDVSLKAALASVGMNASLQSGGIEQQQKLTASDGVSYDFFGNAIALSGDTVVVGMRSDDIGSNIDQGAVYVFTRTGTNWSLQQKLTADDGGTYDSFGFAVAINDNTIVVGAVAHNRNQGAVYVFGRDNGVWTQQQKLTAGNDPGLISFGNAVAMSADRFVVGARDTNVETRRQQGAAYVFTRTGTDWMLQQRLTASDGSDSDYFGMAVAISGDTVAVGAPQDDLGPNLNQGSVYVFTYNGTAWVEAQKLTAGDGAAQDQFGYSVALSGDTLAAGAWLDAIGANTSQGSAYVFVRNAVNWSLQQKLFANDGARGDRFGVHLALSGDTLVAGAYLDGVGANSSQGSAYLFTRSGTQWNQLAKLTASDGAAGDRFGAPIAISGNTIALGATLDNLGTNFDQGSAYVFTCDECPALATSQSLSPSATSSR